MDTATVQLLTPGENPEVLLTAKIKDGQFVLEGTVPEPGCYVIRFGERDVKILLDAPDLFWPSDYSSPDVRYLKNSPAMKT